MTSDQKAKVDSLLESLKSAKHDTIRIQLRKSLSKVYRKTNYDLEIANQKEIIKLAKNGIKTNELLEYYNTTSGYAYMSLGVTYKMKGIVDSALLAYKESEVHYKLVNDSSGLMRVHGNTANAYLEINNINKAVESYEKCLELAILLKNDRATGYTYTGLGIVHKEQGNLTKAIEYYYRGLELSEKIADTAGIGASYSSLALLHKLMGNYDEAIDRYRLNIDLYQKFDNPAGLALVYNNLGNVFEKQRNADSALHYYQLSLVIRENLNDLKGIAGIYSNMSNAYSSKKEFILAEKLLRKSLNIREEIGDFKGMSIALNNLASLYLKLGKHQQAINTVLKSKKIGKDHITKFEVSSQANMLYRGYKKKGNFKLALENYEEYIAIRDNINMDANQKEIIRQDFKYQYEKKAATDSITNAEAQKIKDALLSAEKAENKQHQLEAKQQKQKAYFLYGILGLALLFGGFIFNRFRVTNKQKGIIEEQKEKVDEAFDELEEKNKEIMDSINYAKRIQSAILPPSKVVKEYLQESFILYKPKDIVAGDFYWLEHTAGKVLFAAADCTGHGVPGAMVSVVCNNGLNRSVREYGLTDPGEILDKTREIIIQEFDKSEDEVKDGMDIALCCLEFLVLSSSLNKGEGKHGTENVEQETVAKLQYAGAHNPLWIIRNGEVLETKANKQPIGKFDKQTPYTTHTFELKKGDSIYIFSDGYVDQFGGVKGKKFKSKAFRELLLTIQDKPMENQRTLIDEAFEEWRGDLEQIDDVCVIGVRV